MSFDIIVKNDSRVVYKGNSEIWLEQNDYDAELEDMLIEVNLKGKAIRKFFSGKWEVK